jgi:uncharacterized protein YdeI (YjbR/CyaY-like superfamily)
MTAPLWFATASAFRAWLDRHHASAGELLVGFHKVGTGRPCMTWPESVDEALCYGWIDGVRRRIDDTAYSIRFTPRRPGSIWSAVNLRKVDALIAAGRMRPAGLLAWQNRDLQRTSVYSFEQTDSAQLDDVETERFMLDAAAWTYFKSTPPGYRKTVLHWITTAKKPDTRARRLAELVAACAQGRRLR